MRQDNERNCMTEKKTIWGNHETKTHTIIQNIPSSNPLVSM